MNVSSCYCSWTVLFTIFASPCMLLLCFRGECTHPVFVFISSQGERINSTGSLWLLVGLLYFLCRLFALQSKVLSGNEFRGPKDGRVGCGPVSKDFPAERRKMDNTLVTLSWRSEVRDVHPVSGRTGGTLKERGVSVSVLAGKRWYIQTGIILEAFNKGMWERKKFPFTHSSRFFCLV